MPVYHNHVAFCFQIHSRRHSTLLASSRIDEAPLYQVAEISGVDRILVWEWGGGGGGGGGGGRGEGGRGALF